jgi:hypothetical protein
MALAAGAAITWMDTRPGWDDAGITAGCVFLASALTSVAGARPWLVVLLVAGPMVGAEIAGGYGVLIAVVIAAFGAAVGWSTRRFVMGKAGARQH